MKLYSPSINYLTHFNNSKTSSPGPVIRMEALDYDRILVLFSTSLKLFDNLRKEISSIELQLKPHSLGRYVNTFVVPCDGKTLCFVKIVDSKLILHRKILTNTQFSGAYAIRANCLMCVAENEPRIFVFNEDMRCLTFRDMKYYGVRITTRKSARRICMSSSGHVAISDYANNYVVVFWNGGFNAIVHNVQCPAGIAANEKYLYIVQGQDKNNVLYVRLTRYGKRCVLKEEDGIIYPSCVAVQMEGQLLVAMDTNEPLIKGFISQHSLC